MTTPASYETAILKTVVTSVGPSGIGVLSAAQFFKEKISFLFCRPQPARCLPVVYQLFWRKQRAGPEKQRAGPKKKDLGYKKSRCQASTEDFFERKRRNEMSRSSPGASAAPRQAEEATGDAAYSPLTKRLRDDRQRGLKDLKNDHDGGLIDTPEWAEDKKAIRELFTKGMVKRLDLGMAEAEADSNNKCAPPPDDASDTEDWRPAPNKAGKVRRTSHKDTKSSGDPGHYSSSTKRSNRTGATSKRTMPLTIPEQIVKAAAVATKQLNCLYFLDEQGEEVRKNIPNIVPIKQLIGDQEEQLHIWVVEGEGLTRIAKCSICEGSDWPRQIKLIVSSSHLYLYHTRFTRSIVQDHSTLGVLGQAIREHNNHRTHVVSIELFC